jgi:predicted nucleic acid-binding protein
MVLVDTSVWIRFLAGREPFRSDLRGLLGIGEAVGHELVFGELLIGERGGRAKVLADYSLMVQAATVSHEEVVTFVRDRRLAGAGVGWIDVHLLAAALVGRFKLWTADRRLAELAKRFGLDHQPVAGT